MGGGTEGGVEGGMEGGMEGGRNLHSWYKQNCVA